MDRLERQRIHSATPCEAQQERSRGWLEWISLALSIIAIATAAMSYFDQRDINALTESRFERRYADRVAWWIKTDATGSGSERQTILVQNRSPAPVNSVHVVVAHTVTTSEKPPSEIDGYPIAWKTPRFEGDDWTAERTLYTDDIGPCAIAQFVAAGLESGSTTVTQLNFNDADGRRWTRSESGSLTSMTGHPGTAIAPLARFHEQTVEDCTDS